MSSPPAIHPRDTATREELLAASQRRIQTVILTPEEEAELRYEQERDIRQNFRRLLDPGIMRGVEIKTALSSIKTLLTIAENLLNHPENEKFHQFKSTNNLIRKNLVEVKGALEYAVAMGFRATVKDLQPFYVWNPKRMTELRVGAAVLKEALERESEKEERTARAKAEQKHVVQLQAKQVKLAFEDDRKQRALHDKLEKERREAREVAAAAAAATGISLPPTPTVGPIRRASQSRPIDVDSDEEIDTDEERPPGAFAGVGHRLTNPPPYAPEGEGEPDQQEQEHQSS